MKKQQMIERNFKGVWIPKEVYLHRELSWTQKILLVEIDSLDGEKGCFASNAYFADFLCCEKGYISQCVSKFVKLELVEQSGENGRFRVLRSNMRKLFGAVTVEVKPIKPKRKSFEAPSLEDVVLFFHSNGYSQDGAKKAWEYYNEGEWRDSAGKPVLNWKQKMRVVWFRDEYKATLRNGVPITNEVKIFEGNLHENEGRRG